MSLIRLAYLFTKTFWKVILIIDFPQCLIILNTWQSVYQKVVCFDARLKRFFRLQVNAA